MEIEGAEGVELLIDVGFERRVIGSADVQIRSANGNWMLWHVKVLRHSPSPTEIERALEALTKSKHDGVLFVVSRAGTSLAGAAEQNPRVAYTALRDGTVSLLGERRTAQSDRFKATPITGRSSWAKLAMLRLFALVDWPEVSQSEIARRVGLSHVAIGKQLPFMEPLVERTARGWRAKDRVECWRQFMVGYPGPRGLTSFWTATDDLSSQLLRLTELLREQKQTLTLSGDVAADFYAPLRRPSRITAYVTEQPQLEKWAFANVRSRDATIELRVAKDPTIEAMSRNISEHDGSSRRYADPLISAWDLARTAGGDVPAALERLRDTTLREPLWP